MPRISRRAVAHAITFFDTLDRAVFTGADLAEVLREHRMAWGLPISLTVNGFVEHLQGIKLRSVDLESDRYRSVVRYVWDDASPYDVALSLKKGAYLSHGTAAFLHGLNDQLPKTIYVNHEQSPKPHGRGLTQESLDRAFANKPRVSSLVYTLQDYRIVIVSGKYTGRLEVGAMHSPGTHYRDEMGDKGRLSVTKIERTLIDLAVRPAYGGGVHQVLEAYRGARGRASVGTLLAILKKLDYVYPYHQAIGFYMQKAEYDARQLQRVKQLGLDLDFYLTNAIKQKEYDEQWRLFYPKGM